MRLLLSILQALGTEFMCFRLVLISSFHHGLALVDRSLVGIVALAAVVIVSRRIAAARSRLPSVGWLCSCFQVSVWVLFIY